MVILFENSSDLRSGRRPVSKSDEFSKSITTVDEIRRCENTTFPIHRCASHLRRARGRRVSIMKEAEEAEEFRKISKF